MVVEPCAVEGVPLRHPVLHEEPHLGREVSGHGAVLRTRHLRHAAAAPGQRGQRGGRELTANISNMLRAVSKHLHWAVPFLLLILEPFNVVLQFTGNRLVTRIQMSWLVLAHGGPEHSGRQMLLVFSSNAYHLQAKGKKF